MKSKAATTTTIIFFVPPPPCLITNMPPTNHIVQGRGRGETGNEETSTENKKLIPSKCYWTTQTKPNNIVTLTMLSSRVSSFNHYVFASSAPRT